MNDFFIQLPERQEKPKEKRTEKEIRELIFQQKRKYETADRCGNGLGMQKALIEIEKLEKELEANE